VQKQDLLCILPLNIINEKIYVFLWFWFITLAVVSGAHVVYRLVTVFIPQMRQIMLKSRARLVPIGYVDSVLRSAQIGDWFVLYQLSKNVEDLNFREFLVSLAERMENGETKKLTDYA